MTKTIVSIVLYVYSMLRLGVSVFQLLTHTVRLPVSIIVIAGISVAYSVAAFYLMLKGRLKRRMVRQLVTVTAVCALINILIIWLSAADGLRVSDLIISGTFFDVVFAIGVWTLPMHDHAGRRTGGYQNNREAREARAERFRRRMEDELNERLEEIDQLSSDQTGEPSEDGTDAAGRTEEDPERMEPRPSGVRWTAVDAEKAEADGHFGEETEQQ